MFDFFFFIFFIEKSNTINSLLLIHIFFLFFIRHILENECFLLLTLPHADSLLTVFFSPEKNRQRGAPEWRVGYVTSTGPSLRRSQKSKIKIKKRQQKIKTIFNL